MEELTSTTGLIAAGAVVLAVAALIAAVVLTVKLGHLRRDQSRVLGEGEGRDLVSHASQMQVAVEDMRDFAEDLGREFQQKVAELEERVGRCIAHCAVVRYDAYNEMSGRQSSSVALLDGERTGVVISSILHRDQARVYVKQLRNGRAEIDLSPEESEAVQTALGGQSNGERDAAEDTSGR